VREAALGVCQARLYIEAAILGLCAMFSLIGAQSGFGGAWRASYLVMTIRHIRRDLWGIYAAYIRHWRRSALRHGALL
jgi:hypothetical protein